ncbi:Nif3-like dinuclear metal center hexameric protein [Candidatus Woesebacteria bacterium RIFCSPLOWO2_01_FULL_39_61]|uniref:Nif3-like dinuclear metal center hexameric protein n=1 Tax=Candidatus Woesebacteria bacterium RIFCSPHIGHO2_02_FULL_39_13 TaxID=1802505 RepID=A0A1F7YYH6_9BACT|nr:MAG: Nif3-like dinuclear metal center hexameric protein [Candidatus Woesebacteria bacterium RIFCSPHIGHO2_02_FULL_39_13]OGM37569.1 MAG: Nif3-like dinuclear metal center hexameric protein [Candidatus Woesebacteria bacterium RIFCSPHIGHO2_12_FULL_40_20]OGM65630.1 MAG: Nif3-like dinuclear metal center hexameric protein [Candidatus Woesebacteria bacterium RIFCSPLOWO2_01_FULL_39_61]OGM73921.1 MAG: Nif3-like dinuclear metal center hexameric protein [Candidatus Woesebacteria bacterium RIFCSPLOWO2_12_F
MIQRDILIKFIYELIGKDLLEKALKIDEVANGVQFLGSDKVERVTLGVSLNEEFLKKAIEKNSNFCIFHHGFDTGVYKSRYPSYSQERLRIILKNDLTIMGFHYALDAHPQFGNNVSIIKILGAEVSEPLGNEWGYTAKFDKPQDIHELGHKCRDIFDHEIFVVEGNIDKVKKIGVISGGAKPNAELLAEIEAKGVELFISGETSEHVPHRMKESGINYFVCGHYATEVFGVKALGEEIKKEFKDKLSVEFIDVENPI